MKVGTRLQYHGKVHPELAMRLIRIELSVATAIAYASLLYSQVDSSSPQVSLSRASICYGEWYAE
jgi:hypothetical protein